MQGPWAPSKIANPDYFLDETPLKNIGKVGGVAIEIWTMDNNYYFSNILVDQDPAVAEKARDTYWEPKKEVEVCFLPTFRLHMLLIRSQAAPDLSYDWQSQDTRLSISKDCTLLKDFDIFKLICIAKVGCYTFTDAALTSVNALGVMSR